MHQTGQRWRKQGLRGLQEAYTDKAETLRIALQAVYVRGQAATTILKGGQGEVEEERHISRTCACKDSREEPGSSSGACAGRKSDTLEIFMTSLRHWEMSTGHLIVDYRLEYERVVKSLRNYTALKRLVISKSDFCGQRWFGDEDAVELGEALAGNTTLNSLHLKKSGNLGEVGMRGIAEMLKTITTLTILDLTDIRASDAGAKIMANGIVSNSSLTSLTRLTLSDCGIGANGARDIANSLKTKTSLTELRFDHNKIGDAGAAALVDALNSSLTVLDLSYCGIGANGARDIANSLKTKTSLMRLTQLCLDTDNIGDAGAAALVDALNSSLTALDLSNCGIGANGARDIANSLKTKTSLTVLSLSRNKIGDAGAEALADVLALAKAFKEFQLFLRGIGQQGALALGRAWGSNTALSIGSTSEPDRHTKVRWVCNGVWDEANRVRAEELRKQELLLAFGMAMIKRLGRGRSPRKCTGSPFHYMCKDVFKLVGDAYTY